MTVARATTVIHAARVTMARAKIHVGARATMVLVVAIRVAAPVATHVATHAMTARAVRCAPPPRVVRAAARVKESDPHLAERIGELPHGRFEHRVLGCKLSGDFLCALHQARFMIFARFLAGDDLVDVLIQRRQQLLELGINRTTGLDMVAQLFE